MNKARNKTAFAAAICYIIIAIYRIITLIFPVSYAGLVSPLMAVASCALWVGLAVALIRNNRKVTMYFVVAAILLDVYYSYYYFGLWNLWNLFIVISGGALVLILLFALKKNEAVTKLWFIPGLVKIVGNIISWISYECVSYISPAFWEVVVFGIIEAAAFIFIGLWLKENIYSAETMTANEYTAVNQNTVSSVGNIAGGADKLKMYKELLDNGTITQEEFDTKKNQILGL